MTAIFSSVLQRLRTRNRGDTEATPSWRPLLSADWLVWAVAMYTAAALNQAFWRATAATGAFSDHGGGESALSLALILVGINVLLVRPLCWKGATKPVLTVFLLAAVLTSFFSDRYSIYFDVSMARNILKTDAAEAGDLITSSLLLHVITYAIAPLVLIWSTRLRSPSILRSTVAMFGSIALALMLVIIAALISFKDVSALMRNNRELRHLVAPANVVVSITRIAAKELSVDTGPRRVVAPDARLVGHDPEPKPHVLVLVVGETVRASNWGLNGYARQTTPELAKLDVVNYPDVRACGSSTEVSLPCMFSAKGRASYNEDEIKRSDSLLHVLSRAGIQTLWRDNQGGCKDVCDGLPFEKVTPRNQIAACPNDDCGDLALLDGLEKRVRSSQEDMVIVLHQLGNHGPSYYLRYPERLRRFKPDCRSADLGDCTRPEVVNAYDNAILATDELVSRAIKMLASIDTVDSALLYVSDHGESLGESNLYLHGLPYAIAPDMQMKVPMAAWLSPGMVQWRGLNMQCVRQRALQPASHDNLFHSALGLMDVSTRAYSRELDLFGGCASRTYNDKNRP
ncbi:phosphoethanolamine transferase [Xanthomonas arboricola pv. populi]|uniref:Phosphoethanolamine transferase n=1 Tax=Xanthomonas arboricola pv. populi TaxID=487823 RepID=A0A2S6Z7F1_9XANT|nr:phosphoethanolamine--lipid A transferase [Xanthomonas arboricola]PPT77547.1 phosphoethanolamine transferase [Xanthomonas arboricola pv. populi]